MENWLGLLACGSLRRQGSARRTFGMVVDSQRWKCVEAVPAFRFGLDGVSAVRDHDVGRRGWLTTAEGVVGEVGERHLVMGGEIVLSHSLPGCLSLWALRGTRVRLGLHDERSSSGPRAQTLVVGVREGGSNVVTKLVARFGPAGVEHVIGPSLRVRTALSQRSGGPMTFGTERLQYVVHVGRHAQLADAHGEYVVHVDSRTAFDYVAYAVVDRSLWIG
jgi:hypothetical protein